jgi:hypothetical protein
MYLKIGAHLSTLRKNMRRRPPDGRDRRCIQQGKNRTLADDLLAQHGDVPRND